jgi:hypothetical protein
MAGFFSTGDFGIEDSQLEGVTTVEVAGLSKIKYNQPKRFQSHRLQSFLIQRSISSLRYNP